jgi:hypothetical protein
MSATRSARQLCELALRAIGAFPVTESAADSEQLRTAMDWLDMILAELAGTTRLFALVPATISLPLSGGQSAYNLEEELGSEMPPDGLQFPVNAWLEDAAGNRHPLQIVPRDKFEAVNNAATSGPPRMIHIDRLATAPQLRTYPVLANGVTGWKIKLDVQTYAPDISPGGVTGTQPSDAVMTKFRQAWQLYLVTTLAYHLGSGAIIKLPEASLARFEKTMLRSKVALEAFENREHEATPPICEPWN